MTEPMREPSKVLAKLGRVGVIDVGSNSVRLVVFDGAARSPAYFYNEKVLCGLGRGVSQSRVLHPEGRERAFAALKRFRSLADRFGLEKMNAVATAAVRTATDGPDFCKQVRSELGIALNVISGEQEAHLSAKGILLGSPYASGLVCDIGGSSMEFAHLSDGKVQKALTTDLGPLSLQDLPEGADIAAEISRQLETPVAQMHENHDRLYLVGGSWRAIARLHMVRHSYPLRVLQDYQVEPQSLRATLAEFQELDATELKRVIPVSERRISLLPLAAQVLGQVLDKFDPQKVVFSSYGLREGMLYDQMPLAMRQQNPLLEACWAQEQRNARFPGFGDVLFNWLRPVMGEITALREQSIRAACYLHDVYWRSHPDYRADICFDGATHANFGGISHRGRMFLAWALMHRYGTKKVEAEIAGVHDLLSDEDRAQAEALGKAMRLGSMLSGSEASDIGSLRIDAGQLILTLPAQSQTIFGEVGQKRLANLAKAMGLEPQVVS